MIVDAERIAPVAWKNGRGQTRELARGNAPFWRISLADITEDGPFSAFPGVERVFTLVSGAGLSLAGRDWCAAARPFAPLCFSGALALEARLDAGPCRAFNLMFDAREVRGVVWPLPPGEQVIGGDVAGVFDAGRALLLVAPGEVRVEGGTDGRKLGFAMEFGTDQSAPVS